MIWEFSTWSLFKHYFPARVILHYLSANFSIPDFSSFMCLKNESDWKLNNRIIKDGITISDSNSSWFFTTILSNSTYLLQSMSLFWSYNQYLLQFSSVTQSHPTLCDPMKCSTPGFPCPSPTPRAYSNSCPSSLWCHPAISSWVVPLSSCPQSLPASESFPMSQLFPWGGQSTGASALTSFPPKNTQGWSPLEWTDWISLQSKGLSGVFSNTTVQKHQFFSAQLSSQSNSHIHTWPLEKP